MGDYRLIQDGKVVAEASGGFPDDPDAALREILHYAAVYSQHGEPVTIEGATRADKARLAEWLAAFEEGSSNGR